MTRTIITAMLALASAAALAGRTDVMETASGHIIVTHWPDWCPEPPKPARVTAFPQPKKPTHPPKQAASASPAGACRADR